MSMETPKFNTEPEKGGEMGKRLRKLGLSLSLLLGGGFVAEKIAGRNSAEKAETGGTPENFAVKIESADTVKSNGNMSPESVPGFIKDESSERSEVQLQNNEGVNEKFKVHKSGPDTFRSDEYKH